MDDIVAVLPPLLQSLEALGFVARHLNPPDFGRVMHEIGTPEAALQAARGNLAEWPAQFADVRTALGAASDLLVRHGGTVILSETPETYGAEHLLTRRAVSREVGEKLVGLMRWWEAYCEREGAEMNANPSPGNKAGGLTTILEKSLGAMAKAGSTNLVDVVNYAEAVTKKGFVFMDTPGFDPVSATGQVAGGANVLAFTTGRGSAYGCKPVPSIKIATNSDMYHRMEDDMDINGGDVLDGNSLEAKGREIFEMVLAVASGQKTKSEVLGYGDNEFVPWQVGAVM